MASVPGAKTGTSESMSEESAEKATFCRDFGPTTHLRCGRRIPDATLAGLGWLHAP